MSALDRRSSARPPAPEQPARPCSPQSPGRAVQVLAAGWGSPAAQSDGRHCSPQGQSARRWEPGLPVMEFEPPERWQVRGVAKLSELKRRGDSPAGVPQHHSPRSCHDRSESIASQRGHGGAEALAATLEVGLRRLEEVFHRELQSAMCGRGPERGEGCGPIALLASGGGGARKEGSADALAPKAASLPSGSSFFKAVDATQDSVQGKDRSAVRFQKIAEDNTGREASSPSNGGNGATGATLSAKISENANGWAKSQFKKYLTQHTDSTLHGHDHDHHLRPRVSRLFHQATDAVEHWRDWWVNLREPKRTSALARFFYTIEPVFAFLIIIQSVLMVEQVNSSVYDSVPHWLYVSDYIFTVCYSVELALRLSVHGKYFFVNQDGGWNLLDVFVVSYSIVDMLQPIANIGWLRSLRFLRTVKVLRTFRVVRFLRELRMMLQCLLGSLSSLFWSIVMLLLVLYMFSLVFVQNVAAYFAENESIDPVLEEKLMNDFGSVQRSMLTLYKSCSSGEDWGKYHDEFRKTGSFNTYLFIFFVAFIQIALLNIVTGIFVENAMRHAEPDREAAAMTMRKNEAQLVRELKVILTDFDKDRNGLITPEEFETDSKAGVQLRHYLRGLGIDLHDAVMFFKLLGSASDDNGVDIDSFVQGCLRMRGNATALDLQTLIFELRVMRRSQADLLKEISHQLGDPKEIPHRLGGPKEISHRPCGPKGGQRPAAERSKSGQLSVL